MTALYIAAALALIAAAVFLATELHHHNYADHTQDFRTDAQRERDEASYDELLPDESPIVRRLIAGDAAYFARIEGATDL